MKSVGFVAYRPSDNTVHSGICSKRGARTRATVAAGYYVNRGGPPIEAREVFVADTVAE